MDELSDLLGTDTAVGALADRLSGRPCWLVRALLLDKSEANNWALGWHQDRTIAVRARREVDGFGPWTLKAGVAHVVPPVSLLANMMTMRLHLDPVGQDNAPLLVAPMSHRVGLVLESELDAAISRCGQLACLADRGDVWVYATLILHASERSKVGTGRRVLQLDYSPDELPGGLEWLGLAY